MRKHHAAECGVRAHPQEVMTMATPEDAANIFDDFSQDESIIRL